MSKMPKRPPSRRLEAVTALAFAFYGATACAPRMAADSWKPPVAAAGKDEAGTLAVKDTRYAMVASLALMAEPNYQLDAPANLDLAKNLQGASAFMVEKDIVSVKVSFQSETGPHLVLHALGKLTGTDLAHLTIQDTSQPTAEAGQFRISARCPTADCQRLHAVVKKVGPAGESLAVLPIFFLRNEKKEYRIETSLSRDPMPEKYNDFVVRSFAEGEGQPAGDLIISPVPPQGLTPPEGGVAAGSDGRPVADGKPAAKTKEEADFESVANAEKAKVEALAAVELAKANAVLASSPPKAAAPDLASRPGGKAAPGPVASAPTKEVLGNPKDDKDAMDLKPVPMEAAPKETAEKPQAEKNEAALNAASSPPTVTKTPPDEKTPETQKKPPTLWQKINPFHWF